MGNYISVEHWFAPIDGHALGGNIPDEAIKALFGATNSPGSMPTSFAILDASANPYIPELIAQVAGKTRPIYDSVAEQSYSAQAPWLIELKPDDRFLRKLFSFGEAPWHLWGNGLGIFLRATATFDQVRNHLRRFLKIRDANGKWYYFRFWEPATAAAFFGGLEPESSSYMRWAWIGEAERIVSVLTPGADGGLQEFPFRCRANIARPNPFSLSQADVNRMGKALDRRANLALATLLHQPDDARLTDRMLNESKRLCLAQIVRAAAGHLGITDTRDIERIARLSRIYGLEFYLDPRCRRQMPSISDGPTAQMHAILDQRDELAHALLGKDEAGGLSSNFLQTDGSWAEFLSFLRCDLPIEGASKFHELADKSISVLPRAQKIWLAFYLGHRLEMDPRYELNKEMIALDPEDIFNRVSRAIKSEILARPI